MYSAHLHPECEPSLIDGLVRIIELVDALPETTVFNGNGYANDVLGVLLAIHGNKAFDEHEMWNYYGAFTKNTVELLTNIFGIHIGDTANLHLVFNHHFTKSIFEEDEALVMSLFTSAYYKATNCTISKCVWLAHAHEILSKLLLKDIKNEKGRLSQ